MAIALPNEPLNSEKADRTEKAAALFEKVQGMQITRKLGMMAMIAASVAVGLAVFFWSQEQEMVALYTGTDAKATAEAADLLRTAQIPFKLDPATGAITVAPERLHDARLKLAGAGATDNGRLGFEMIERDPGFGVSQFVENARYQHALETELVRTITTLRPVQDARVHLAIPKPSAFTRQRELSSASVVLTLRGGSTLERNQVDAIVHMVASSIPDMAPDRVTVVDQNGRLLSGNSGNPADELNAAQFEQVRRQETSFNQRIRDLLEPMTGVGRVQPEVAVEMDFATIEEAREVYNGEPQKLRSEQINETSNSVPGPQGVPGAASNTPPGPEAVAATPATAQSSRNATRNFELDRTLQHTRQPGGRISRVTVAVLVDHVPRANAEGKIVPQALSQAELGRVEALVKQAVGFNAERGDSVSVMNAPFVRETAPVAAPPLWEHPRAQDALRLVLGALIILALLFGVVRPTLRQLTGAGKKPVAEPVPATADIELVDINGQPLPALAADQVQLSPTAVLAAPVDNYEERLRMAREAVRADSKRVAQVVKGWVAND
ncbi:MAG: flagellar basal-body MS-ring/collar protein FliF [Stenotrophomonas koreensis]|jgi:flagellar basal-body M-ring protein/flagellar hook-basal body protein (fliF)